jgi:hypothetical protein
LINVVCDGALLLGFGQDQVSIGPDAVREVADDLELVPVSEEERTKPTRAADDRRPRGFRALFRRRSTRGT